jgi:uncharacterized protein with NRDE domain
MCTLAVYHRQFEAAAVVIAANRDESYARATAPPHLLSRSPAIYGGQDLVHGGTWLAINPSGMAAALLNRRSTADVDPRLRSRGLLCLDALRHGSARSAIEHLRRIPSKDYNPFNLLIVDPQDAWVLTNNGYETKTVRLDEGLHLISNLDVDDPECPRIATSTTRFWAIGDSYRSEHPADLLEAFRMVLADHGTPMDPRASGPTSGLCVHLGTYGTRSSTLLAYEEDSRRWSYFQASGPPCEKAFESIRLPTPFVPARA